MASLLGGNLVAIGQLDVGDVERDGGREKQKAPAFAGLADTGGRSQERRAAHVEQYAEHGEGDRNAAEKRPP